MKIRKSYWSTIPLSLLFSLILAIIIHFATYFPSFIEKHYSLQMYPKISSFLRIITHYFPFSVGDCIYILLVLNAIFGTIFFIYRLFNQYNKELIRKTIYKIIGFLLNTYILFMLFWGLNYSREGIGYQLKVSPTPYSTEDLCQLSLRLITEMNLCKTELDSIPTKDSSLQNIYLIAEDAYKTTAEKFPLLTYHHPSIKSSLFTSLAPVVGFTGYYNPFSGEAQVRKDLPRILIPFITCHEMAHQIGYADESEASFVALIVSENSHNNYLRYSALIDLYRFTRMELFLRNTYPDGPDKLSKSVKADLIYIQNFFRKEAHKQSESINNAYDMYLKFNGLEKGIESYNDVVAWAIQWYKLKDKERH